MSGVSQGAGVPDALPIQGNTDAQLVRAQLADETNRIIVEYRQPTTAAAVNSTVSQQVAQVTGHGLSPMGSTATGAQIFILEETLHLEGIQEIVQEIETIPGVEYAEPDKRVFPLYTPDDPRYNEQWHYFEDAAGIRLPEAWDSSRGEGVLVAIIDTGYTEHEDLIDNLQLPGYDLMHDISMSNDGDGRDQDAHDPGDWSPECGVNQSSWHGTHTAGTVAAIGNNGIGVIGAAFNARVLPVRVLGKCGGWLSELADGIIWAAGGELDAVPTNQTPAQVLNLSLGVNSSGCSQYMQQAIDTARELGSTIIVAAGNTNSDAAGFEPANCSGVITVAATDRDGNRAAFSNYGEEVDIAAPGVRILSTLNTGATTPASDTYAYYQGTSMATPQVSGVAALLYAISPDITPGEVEQLLKDTARPFPGSCNGCGVGLLDAVSAVAALSATIPDPDPDPQPDLILLQNGVAQTGLSGQAEDRLMFAIDVPLNAENLTFTMNGGSGDADLYVRFGSEPTLKNFDCRPYMDGNNETCQISNLEAGRYYVLINGYSAFSDVSLTASYDEDSNPNPDPQPGLVILQNGVAQSGLSGQADEKLMFAIDLPLDATNLQFTISGGSGDADLYVRFGSEPSLSSYDCRPYLSGNNESCQISNPQAGRYYVMVHGYRAFSGATLVASYEEYQDPYPTPDPGTRSFENSDDFMIPDFSFNGVGSPIDVTLTGTSGTVDTHVEIKHPSMQEVIVELVSPDDRNFILSLGGGGENLSETYTLNLGGIPASGRWILRAIDLGFSGQGYIDGWSITFRNPN